MFLLVFLGVLLVLAALLIVKKFRAKIQDIILKILEKTFFNNLIRSINLSYLKSALAFVLAIEVFNNAEGESFSQDAFITFLPLIILGSIPVICFIALYKYQNRLEEKAIKDRIEKMYIGVALNRNFMTKYIYPIFLVRRFLFVLIPISFPDYVYF